MSPSTENGNKTGGSGSGGSIQLHAKYLIGYGVISAAGGSTDRDGTGGQGGGGRILIKLLEWENKEIAHNHTSFWHGAVSVAPGDGSAIKIPEDQSPFYIGKGSNFFK